MNGALIPHVGRAATKSLTEIRARAEGAAPDVADTYDCATPEVIARDRARLRQLLSQG
jgi:imidazolonepropionase-like amidohydrolase